MIFSLYYPATIHKNTTYPYGNQQSDFITLPKLNLAKKIMLLFVIALIIVVVYKSYNLLSSNPTLPSNYVYSGINASKVSRDNNNFAFKLYSKLTNESNESDNIFFSPFSIYTALSMAEQGARGNTSRQMQTVLGLPNNSTATNSGFESIIEGLNSQKGITLSIADSIWVEKIFTINPGFSNTLSKYYGAEVYPADFLNDASGETTNINNWVSSKTDQKIMNLIPAGVLTKNTTLVLADAVYFKGAWQIQFNKDNTTNETFYAPSQQVQVPMMHLTTGALYYANNNLQALELNYRNSNLSMLILLPAQGYSLSQMQSNLSAPELDNITSGLRSDISVAISLPRYNMTEAEELNNALKSLGMTNAFDSTSANFSGMGNYSAYPNAVLYITHVLHKAFIQVNEQGTQAAAATAVGGAVPGVVILPIMFNADHPFVFFIIDKQSGTILFMGRLSNPTNS